MLTLRAEMQDSLPAEVFFVSFPQLNCRGFNAHHGRLVLIVRVSLHRKQENYLSVFATNLEASSDWENNILYYGIYASAMIFFQKRILSFSPGFPEPQILWAKASCTH